MAELAKTVEQILASVRFVDKLSIVSFRGATIGTLRVSRVYTRNSGCDYLVETQKRDVANRIVLRWFRAGCEGGRERERRREER